MMMNRKSEIQNPKLRRAPRIVFATIACGLCVAVGLLAAAAPCQAGCKVKTRVVVSDVVAVPVAVSVGVPVAVVAPYYYSYQQYAPATQPVDVEAIAARVVEKLRESQPAPKPATAAAAPSPPAEAPLAPPASLVSQRCVQCHGGPAPKGSLSLESLATLSCEQKLKAVRAVLSEKMPKTGPRLTPDEAGQILEELTKP